MKVFSRKYLILVGMVFITSCQQDSNMETVPLTESPMAEMTALSEDTTVTQIKMYILDNGIITGLEPELFNFTADEVAETDFVVTSNLIVHPDGILLWESGMIPDDDFPVDGSPAIDGVSTSYKTMRGQLAEIGYTKEDIDYLVLSHLHADHNGNANEYSGSHWIVQRADRDMMFAGVEQQIMVAENFKELENSETTILENEDYDVFGDGSVMIISAPGHTPGHQVLLVNLPNTGPVLLAGDLYHYPEEITTGRFPTFEFDPAISAVSREKVAKLIEETNAQMWIGHDKPTHEALNFSPAYYD